MLKNVALWLRCLLAAIIFVVGIGLATTIGIGAIIFLYQGIDLLLINHTSLTANDRFFVSCYVLAVCGLIVYITHSLYLKYKREEIRKNDK